MAAIVVKAEKVDSRLHELGWTVSEMLEIVDAMVGGRQSCTENDPQSAPGWMAWKQGSRRLREIGGAKKGFVKDNSDSVAAVIDTKRGARFVVCNADENTGIDGDDVIPQFRTKRERPTTAKCVLNNQLSFIDQLIGADPTPITRVGKQPQRMLTWYICVYHENDVCRAEISCPVGVLDGCFTNFVERIILEVPDGSGAVRMRLSQDLGGGAPLEIPVTRKS